MADLETALEPEGTRTKLKRELRAEAMTRLEEAARTEKDFENVVACWDKLDANRERKERKRLQKMRQKLKEMHNKK